MQEKNDAVRLTVRNVPKALLAAIKAYAAKSGISQEQEILNTLEFVYGHLVQRLEDLPEKDYPVEVPVQSMG